MNDNRISEALENLTTELILAVERWSEDEDDRLSTIKADIHNILSVRIAAIQSAQGEVDLRGLWEAGVEHGYGHALRAAAVRDPKRDEKAFNEALLTARRRKL